MTLSFNPSEPPEGYHSLGIPIRSDFEAQQAIESIVGGRGEDAVSLHFAGRLSHDISGTPDSLTLSVHIGKARVGFVELGSSSRLRDLFSAGESPVDCDLHVVGGWYRSRTDQSDFHVYLDLGSLRQPAAAAGAIAGQATRPHRAGWIASGIAASVATVLAGGVWFGADMPWTTTLAGEPGVKLSIGSELRLGSLTSIAPAVTPDERAGEPPSNTAAPAMPASNAAVSEPAVQVVTVDPLAQEQRPAATQARAEPETPLAAATMPAAASVRLPETVRTVAAPQPAVMPPLVRKPPPTPVRVRANIRDPYPETVFLPSRPPRENRWRNRPPREAYAARSQRPRWTAEQPWRAERREPLSVPYEREASPFATHPLDRILSTILD